MAGAYLPPLRFGFLTRWYDAVVDATTRSTTWRAQLVSLAALRHGESALDIGCGTGTLAVALADSAPGAAVFGIDADTDALAIAAGKAGSRAVRLHRGMAQALPFADGTFDLVVSSLFFHHLADPIKRATLREARRVLRAGGRLLVSDWGRPTGPLTHAGFALVRLLDGFETTRASVAGALPGFLVDEGFAQPTEHEPVVTALGVVRLWSARPR